MSRLEVFSKHTRQNCTGLWNVPNFVQRFVDIFYTSIKWGKQSYQSIVLQKIYIKGTFLKIHSLLLLYGQEKYSKNQKYVISCKFIILLIKERVSYLYNIYNSMRNFMLWEMHDHWLDWIKWYMYTCIDSTT